MSNECKAGRSELVQRTMAMAETNTGNLIVFSGPSGAGKSSLVKQLLAHSNLPLELSVSATTRPPRNDEEDGVDYHFLSPEEFTSRRKAGDFLEFMDVFGCGDWYGTLRIAVTTGLNAGKSVILEIDVQGALSVLEQMPDAITIFIHPGSLEELERRLRKRGTDSEKSIRRRLEVAGEEMQFISFYRHEVINDSIDRAVSEIHGILTQSGVINKCSKN